MDRWTLSTLAHVDHPVAAPVGAGTVDRLLARTRPPAAARFLDVGCGPAAWSVRALQLYATARGTGIDVSRPALEAARRAADAAGVGQRLTLLERDAAAVGDDQSADVVLCVGASHALGGLGPALPALGRVTRPHGLLLVGEGFWARPPTPEALRALGAAPEEFRDLPGTVDFVQRAGWTPVYGHVSTEDEWDDYEWSWTGSLARWALEHPEAPGQAAAARAAAEHREEWLRGYRGVLGFVCLLLARTTR